jgi:lysophospholipase L1-like esterase
MQGLFIADDETPPERLRRDLETHLGRRVSVLNTGHLGYSPEQEYFTLIEYAGRFHPSFVILSLFANDFGDVSSAAGDQAAWRESGYWIGRIARYCEEHGLLLLTVPAPLEKQLAARRQTGRYQGRITRILATPSLHFLDPIENFVNINIKLLHEAESAGRRPATSPLFNGVISDGHFSAIGARVWAEAVSERLRLLMKDEEATSPRDSKSRRDREHAGDETRES